MEPFHEIDVDAGIANVTAEGGRLALLGYPLTGIGRGRTPALHVVPAWISRDIPNL